MSEFESPSKSSSTNTVVIDVVGDEINHKNDIENTFVNEIFEEETMLDVYLDTALSEDELQMLPDNFKLNDLLPYFPPFKCPFDQCKKVFEDRVRLQKHYRNHEERKHACQFCKQKFLYLKDKKIHERIHTGERPHVCQICNKAFVQKCTLNNHLKTHDKRLKNEVCNICGRGYTYKKSLALHKKMKHSSLLSEDQIYTCGKCGRKYLELFQYKNHEAKCEGLKRRIYTCSSCNKSFDTKSSLQTHKESCWIQVFQCGVCNVVMSAEKNLRLHMTKAHHVGYNECVKVRVLDGDNTKQTDFPQTSAFTGVTILQEAAQQSQETGLIVRVTDPVDSHNANSTSTRLAVFPPIQEETII